MPGPSKTIAHMLRTAPVLPKDSRCSKSGPKAARSVVGRRESRTEGDDGLHMSKGLSCQMQCGHKFKNVVPHKSKVCRVIWGWAFFRVVCNSGLTTFLPQHEHAGNVCPLEGWPAAVFPARPPFRVDRGGYTRSSTPLCSRHRGLVNEAQAHAQSRQ